MVVDDSRMGRVCAIDDSLSSGCGGLGSARMEFITAFFSFIIAGHNHHIIGSRLVSIDIIRCLVPLLLWMA